MSMIGAIVTVPPYATFIDEVAAHPLVQGLRLNTVMPVQGDLRPVLRRLAACGKPIWVDLKARQLRVVGAAIPPFTEVRVSHRVHFTAPATAFFSDGREMARVVAAEGDRLILEDGPRRLIGPGESVNLVACDLTVEGTLTDNDRAYLEAMGELGMRQIMLSFTERPEDVAEVRRYLPGAEVVCKIESQRGLEFTRRHGSRHGRLMAARGDLYVEVVRPHRVLGALRQVLQADPQAIVASRLFGSLARCEVPEAADLGDAAHLLLLGYRTFMLGDEVCLRGHTVLSALNLLQAVGGEVLAA